MTDEDAIAAEHTNYNRMFERGNEGDEGLSPASEVLPVWELEPCSFTRSCRTLVGNVRKKIVSVELRAPIFMLILFSSRV